MGYTNYAYKTDRNEKTFPANFTSEVRKVIATAQAGFGGHAPIQLAGWDGNPDTPIEITEECINFNGVGEDSHENCIVESYADCEHSSRPISNLMFCKTRLAPYDCVVKAVYYLAQKYGILEDISCDDDYDYSSDSYAACVDLLKASGVEVPGVTDGPVEQ